jgi:hypothetical protein
MTVELQVRWLIDPPFTTIIAPTNWLKAPGIDSRNLIPEDWLRI